MSESVVSEGNARRALYLMVDLHADLREQHQEQGRRLQQVEALLAAARKAVVEGCPCSCCAAIRGELPADR